MLWLLWWSVRDTMFCTRSLKTATPTRVLSGPRSKRCSSCVRKCSWSWNSGCQMLLLLSRRKYTSAGLPPQPDSQRRARGWWQRIVWALGHLRNNYGIRYPKSVVVICSHGLISLRSSASKGLCFRVAVFKQPGCHWRLAHAPREPRTTEGPCKIRPPGKNDTENIGPRERRGWVTLTPGRQDLGNIGPYKRRV